MTRRGGAVRVEATRRRPGRVGAARRESMRSGDAPGGPRRRGRRLAPMSAAGNGQFDLKHRSRALTEGRDRAAARAYLKGIGYDDEALSK